MSVWFKHNRLFVGYRLRDWTEVWYEPITEENKGDDDRPGRELFRFSKGVVDDEPTEGELAWEPLYDPKNCEARAKPEIRLMHAKFLHDAHTYMREKDEERLRALEKHYRDVQPHFTRWNRWLMQARVVKKRQLGGRKWRAMKARERGVKEHEMSTIDLDSGDDSAYESEMQAAERAKKAREGMPPPPRPTKRNAKRKPTGVGGGGSKGGKRPRTHSSSAYGSTGSPEPRDFFMSGGLGRGSTRGLSQSRSVSEAPSNTRYQTCVDDDHDDESDNESLDWIPGHPEPPVAQPNANASSQDPTSTNSPGSGSGSRRLFRRFSQTSAAGMTSGRFGNGHVNGQPGAEPGIEHDHPLLRRLSGTSAAGMTDNQRGDAQLNGEHETEHDADGGTDPEDEARRRRATEVNGHGVDEEEAYCSALRASVQPEQINGGDDEDEALQRAIRESTAHEQRNEGGISGDDIADGAVRRSIEGEEGDVETGDQVDDGSAAQQLHAEADELLRGAETAAGHREPGVDGDGEGEPRADGDGEPGAEADEEPEVDSDLEPDGN